MCGLLNAQAITYYKSETYSDKQEIDPLTGKPVPGMLRGSAVCTRTQIVCLDPECSQIDSANLCHMTTLQAWLDLTMTIMLLILMMVVTTAQNQISTQLDESIQTAQDYSVSFHSPILSLPNTILLFETFNCLLRLVETFKVKFLEKDFIL